MVAVRYADRETSAPGQASPYLAQAPRCLYRKTTIMWLLNILILTIASISVGFLLGWVAFRPRRWDYTYKTVPTRHRVLDDESASLTTRS